MTRRILAMLAGAAAALVPVSAAQAAPGPFDAGSTYPMTSKYCDSTAPIVIWANRIVVNREDTGILGNTWALEKYSEEILVRRVAKWGSYGLYCAAVRDYGGAFVTLGGVSPGGTSFVNAGISGTMMGAYKTVNFWAVYRPLAPAFGSVGVLDCAVADCPGARDWVDLWFTDVQGYGLDYHQWVYSTPANGMWINRSVGNSGDIVG